MSSEQKPPVIDFDVGLFPQRIAIDANILIMGIEANEPKWQNSRNAQICEVVLQIALKGGATLVVPSPALAEWWVGSPKNQRPSGKGLEDCAFDASAASLMRLIGTAGIKTASGSTGVNKQSLKFDAMILACVWRSGTKILLTNNKADFTSLLALDTIPPEYRITILNPEEFYERYKTRGQIPLPIP